MNAAKTCWRWLPLMVAIVVASGGWISLSRHRAANQVNAPALDAAFLNDVVRRDQIIVGGSHVRTYHFLDEESMQRFLESVADELDEAASDYLESCR